MSERDDQALHDASTLGEPAAEPAESTTVYDPSKHNVPEVEAYLRAASTYERGRVFAAERDGRARKGVLALADELFGADSDTPDDDQPRTVVDGPGLAPRELLPSEGHHRELAPVDTEDERARKLAPFEKVDGD